MKKEIKTLLLSLAKIVQFQLFTPAKRALAFLVLVQILARIVLQDCRLTPSAFFHCINFSI